MKKVLVLGATGFIGRSLTDKLDAECVEWLGVSKKTLVDGKPIVNSNKITVIESFLADDPIVIVASGGLKPRDYLKETIQSVDLGWKGIQESFELLNLGKPAKIVLISSAGTVYGESSLGRSSEKDSPNPVTWYGRHKLTEELLFSNFCELKGIPLVIARVSNPYGNSGVVNHGFVDVLVEFVLNDRPFEASFHPDSERDFIHATDMARKIIGLSKIANGGIYNLGNGESVRLSDIVKFVQNIRPEAKVTYKEPVKSTDIVVSRISTKKIEAMLSENTSDMDVFEYINQKLKGA